VILAEIGKFVGARVATAVIFLAAAAGGYWCYQNPDALKAGASVVKLTLVWLLVAAGLPWTSYLFIGPLMSRQSAMASAQSAGAVGVALIAAYSLVDVLLALWLAGWSLAGGFGGFVVVLGILAAAAYNFVICESLARHADS
jgi:hypothetical protein